MVSIAPGRVVPAVPEEWTGAVNKAINDATHKDLCGCDGWPDACTSDSYRPGLWDLGAVELAIAVGVLEPLIRGRIAAEQSATVSTSQAAEIIGVSRATMVRYLDERRIPHSRPGKHRRVLLADVLAFKAETTHGKHAEEVAS